MIPRILVIRGGALGDFILTLPAIRLLREGFPTAHLEILGYKHIIALADGRHYAHATRSIEYAAMAGFFVPNSELAPDLVEYFGGFQQVISYLFDPDGIFRGNLRRAGVRNIIQGNPKITDAEHAAVQLARPLQQLSLFLDDASAVIYPSDTDAGAAAEFLAGEKAPLIALHPGSGSDLKNWPLPAWERLGHWIVAQPCRPTIVLIGGEADGVQLSTLTRAWAGKNVILARDLPLPMLAAIIKRCDLFVGHDTGISHLAAAVETPCILLFGPTDPTLWAPANRAVTVLEAADARMSSITVDTVSAAVAKVFPL